MDFEILTTDRLELRKITPEVVKYIWDNYSDIKIKTFLGLNSDEELVRERDKLKIGIRTYNKTFLYFQLIEKESKNIIGWCGYHTWYLDHQRAEIGYELSKEDIKRKGFMTEALKEIIDYGFSTIKLNRIEAMVGTNNIASKKLLINREFKYEGLLREHYLKGEKIESSEVYSLLKKEYPL